jgi:DNA-binding MarR family transcriptional regulator
MESTDRDTCACHDVTHLQGMVLLEIAKNQPLNMQQLAQSMQLAVSTMSRVVDKLVNAGLIDRQPDKDDRRVVQCTLTKAGEDIAQQLKGCYDEFFDKLVANIPPADLPGFLSGLRIMVKQVLATISGCGCGDENVNTDCGCGCEDK